jgi:hypothetical protein
LVILALLSKTSAWQKGVRIFGYRLSTIITFAALTIIHFTTSLAGLISLIAFFLVRKVRERPLVTLGAVFFVGWLIYGATAWFEASLPDFISNAFKLEHFGRGYTEAVAGGGMHRVAVWLKLASGALVVGIALAGGFLGRKSKGDNKFDVAMLALVIGYLILGLIVMPAYTGFNLRVLFYLLPVVAYFGVKLLNLKRGAAILCLSLLPILPLFFIANYGNAAIEIFSQPHITGMHFVEEYRTHGAITGTISGGTLRQLSWKDNELTGQYPNYICVDRYWENGYELVYDDPTIKEIHAHLENTTNCNLIYANPDVCFYLYEHPP